MGDFVRRLVWAVQNYPLANRCHECYQKKLQSQCQLTHVIILGKKPNMLATFEHAKKLKNAVGSDWQILAEG